MNAITNGLTPTLPTRLAESGAGLNSPEQMKAMGSEFESVFLSMMLKEMRNSLDEGLFGGDSSDSFGGMFDLFIGQHLAESNPIGIGDLVLQQYSQGQPTDDNNRQPIEIKA